MRGEKEQLDSLIRFTGKPKTPDKPAEISKWKKFLAFINPFAKKTTEVINEAKGLTRDFYQAEIKKKNSEADKFGAEAAEKAASAELKITEKVKLVNDEISNIYFSDLPEQAKALQLANLIANNPEISKQLDKINELMQVMHSVNFSEFQIKIERSNLTESENPENKSPSEENQPNDQLETYKRFECEVYLLDKEEGGRHTPLFNNFSTQFHFRHRIVTGKCKLPNDVEMALPGDNVDLSVELDQPVAIEPGLRFRIVEDGSPSGAGVVTKVFG